MYRNRATGARTIPSKKRQASAARHRDFFQAIREELHTGASGYNGRPNTMLRQIGEAYQIDRNICNQEYIRLEEIRGHADKLTIEEGEALYQAAKKRFNEQHTVKRPTRAKIWRVSAPDRGWNGNGHPQTENAADAKFGRFNEALQMTIPFDRTDEMLIRIAELESKMARIEELINKTSNERVQLL